MKNKTSRKFNKHLVLPAIVIGLLTALHILLTLQTLDLRREIDNNNSVASDQTLLVEDLNGSTVEIALQAQDELLIATVTNGTIKNGMLSGNYEITLEDGTILNGNTPTSVAGDTTVINEDDAVLEFSDGSISTAKITDFAVTNQKLAENSISVTKIIDASITNAKIASGTIMTTNLADNSISISKIQDGAVTTSKLASNSVTTDKIVNGSVTTVDIAINSISNDLLQDESVEIANLANSACSDGEIIKKISGIWQCGSDLGGSGFISTATAGNGLNNSGTTFDPIFDVNVDGTTLFIAANTLQVQDLGINTNQLANLAVTEAKLGANAVINTKIANGAISLNKLSVDSVDTTKIVDGTIQDTDVSITAAIGWNKISKTSASLADIPIRNASDINIVDAGGYFTTTDIEMALQEIALDQSNDVNTIDNISLLTNDVGYLTSQYWTQLNNNIYYNTGNVGIGRTNSVSTLDILGTNDQVQFSLEAHTTQTSNLFEINSNGGSGGDLVRVGSTGNLVFGTNTAIIFDRANDSRIEDDNTNLLIIPGAGGKRAVFQATSGGVASTITNYNTNGGTGTGTGFLFASGGVTDFIGGVFGVRTDATTNARVGLRVLDSGGLTGVDTNAMFYVEGGAVSRTVVNTDQLVIADKNDATIVGGNSGGASIAIDGANLILRGGTGGVISLTINGAGYSFTNNINAPAFQSQAYGSASAPTYRFFSAGTQTGLYAGLGPTTGSREVAVTSAGNFVAQFSSSGNVGIGTTDPAYRLDAQQTTDGIVAAFTDNDNNCTIDPDIAGGVSCSSDARKKKNVLGISSALDTVNVLNPVSYEWINGKQGERYEGFLAQDVEQVLPNLVSTDSNGYKLVNYVGFIPTLVAAIQEQQAQINSLGNGSSEEILGEYIRASEFNQYFSLEDGNLAIIANTEFREPVSFNDSATFRSSVVFEQDTTFSTRISVGKDIANNATISVGQTQVNVFFSQPYDTIPQVVATPQVFVTGPFRITNQTINGFTIELQQVQTEDIVFTWFATEEI